MIIVLINIPVGRLGIFEMKKTASRVDVTRAPATNCAEACYSRLLLELETILALQE
jgi:hypothetical protein